MSDDLPERVARVESRVSQHSESIARLTARQESLEQVMDDLRAGVSRVDGTLDALREDVQNFSRDALQSWPPGAVEAITRERNGSNRLTHMLVGMLGAAVAVITGLLLYLHR